MRYHDITKDDMKNGIGLRVVLWLSGCSHECPGCQNPITWDPNGGLVFDENAKAEIWDYLERDYIDGITFSGGDPLYENNREELFELIKEIRECFPNKTIWLYTGYIYENIESLELLDYVDVLIDGLYVEAQRNVTLHWVGSDNQRVIDVKATKKEGKVVLYEKDC